MDALCGAALCGYFRLNRDKCVGNGNRWLAAVGSLLHRRVLPDDTFHDLIPDDVQELHRVLCKAQYATHDVEKDLLLCGFGNVAVHHV